MDFCKDFNYILNDFLTNSIGKIRKKMWQGKSDKYCDDLIKH